MSPGDPRETQFLGVLESPLDLDAPTVGERLAVRGWALGLRKSVDEVRALWSSSSQGSTTPQPLAFGLRRTDVALALPDRADAAPCGFVGDIDLPSEPAVLIVQALSGGVVLHEWRRPIRPLSLACAWPAWRERLHLPLAEPAPVIEWLVSGQPCKDPAVSAVGSAPPAPGQGQTAGHWLGVLQPGDRLIPSGLAALTNSLASLLQRGSAADVLIADHELSDPGSPQAEPVLKPGWHERLRSHPDVHQRAWLVRLDPAKGERTAGLRQLIAGGHCEAAMAWALRDARELAQLRWPLVQGPATVAPGAAPPMAAPAVGTRSSSTHTSVSATAPDSERVSVIIPSCLASPEMLALCLDGLFATADVSQLDVWLLLNNLRGFTPETAARWLSRWPVRSAFVEGAFNWSALNNEGLRRSQAPWCLLLNDDVQPISAGWLTAMLSLARSPDTGAVGAVLRYGDGRLQHAGIGWHGGREPVCQHLFRGCTGQEPRVARWLTHDREVTAVTGACLLVARVHVDRVGGFDEALPLVFNDVDFCLRLREAGLRQRVAAGAELFHHERLSRGRAAEDADTTSFALRWQAQCPPIDPYGHPLLDLDREDWMPDLSVAPRALTDLHRA